MPVFSLLVLLLTLYINYLASMGYVNNTTTGEVSGLYPTLFTPAGFTFAIWGFIYLLNLLFAVRQIYLMIKRPAEVDYTLNGLFVLICLTNAVWIFTWHLMKIGLAWLLIMVILTLLVAAYQRVSKTSFGSSKFFWEYINFSVYMGWISVATVANGAIYLTKLGAPATGNLAATITVIIIAIIMFLTVFMVLREGNLFYAMVILWASYGIIMARASEEMPGSKIVGVVTLVSMIVIFLSLGYRAYLLNRASKSSSP